MNFSKNCPIDLPALLAGRMLIQANSGGGKSHALRRLLEQTAPHVQQLIIDSEGEFATLREKFDYIIAAPHDGDAVASPQTAALLAKRLLESGVSAVLDIYDLKANDRQLFVKRFLEALVDAPRAIWHPVLVVLDEAHIYCPQNGSAIASSAVIDIACRGRKRGQCLVVATQRLAKLHKDCVAEMLNKLIGRTGLDIDVKRAADELGMTSREAMMTLRSLKPGQFYAFGPALSLEVEMITVGTVQTTHPKAGHGLMKAPPAASKRVLEQLAKLADLQREAEEEARTLEQLKAQNADLKRQLGAAEKRAQAAGTPEAEIQKRIQSAIAADRSLLYPVHERMRKLWATLITSEKEGAAIAKEFEILMKAAPKSPMPSEVIKKSLTVTNPPATLPRLAKGDKITINDRPVEILSTSNSLTGPQQRILDAIAWLEAIGVAAPEQPAVAFLAGYKYGGGAYNNPRGQLHKMGLVNYPGNNTICLTDSGRPLANFPDQIGTNEELHERVLARLGGPEQRLLRPLLDAYPDALSHAELAEAAGYTAGAGAFNNPRGRLSTLGLIEYPHPGFSVARKLLFPK